MCDEERDRSPPLNRSSRCAPDKCRQMDEDDDDHQANNEPCSGASASQQPTKRSKSLSSAILDYYTRYGQNRDLEKYLRFRKYTSTGGGGGASCQRSSSDDSSTLQQQLRQLSQEQFVSSSQSLNRSASRSSHSSDTMKAAVPTTGSQSARGGNSSSTSHSAEMLYVAKLTPKRSVHTKVSKSESASRSENDLTTTTMASDGKDTATSKDRKKVRATKSSSSLTSRSLYSLTSNIEINISNLDALLPKERPPPASPAPLLPPRVAEHSTQTQSITAFDDGVVVGKAVSFATRDLVAEVDAVPGTTATDADALHEKQPADMSLSLCAGRPSSADSSVVSTATGGGTKPRLEWDSLADVGYEKASQTDAPDGGGGGGAFPDGAGAAATASGAAYSDGSLSAFEREALQKFFAERGVPFDGRNLLASLDDPKLAESTEKRTEQVEDEKHEDDEVVGDEEEQTIVEECSSDGKELQSAKQSPHRADLPSTSTIGRLFASADAASTPISSVSRRSKQSDELKTVQTQTEQTVSSKAVQFDSLRSPPSAAAVAEIVDDQLGPNADDVASLNASFTFVPGSAGEAGNADDNVGSNVALQRSDDRVDEENEENIAPVAVETAPSRSKNSSKVSRKEASTASAATSQYDSHTEEIIRTILCSSNSEQSSSAIEASNDTDVNESNNSSTSMMRDLRRGIELLDRLVESERLNKATKKRLVKKIVNGLLKAKYSISTTNVTSMDGEDAGASRNGAIDASVKNRDELETKISADNAKQPPPDQQSPRVSLSRISQQSAKPVVAENVSTITRPSSKTTQQWLKPLTRSEHDYEAQLRQQSRKPHHPRQRPIATKESVKLQWIQQEIRQLVQLQDFLVHKRRHQPSILDDSNTPNNTAHDRRRRLYENTNRPVTTTSITSTTPSTENYYCQVAGATNKYNSSTSTYASTKLSGDSFAVGGAQLARKLPTTSKAAAVAVASAAAGHSIGIGTSDFTVPTATGLRTLRHMDDDQRGDSSDSALIVGQKSHRNRVKLRTPIDNGTLSDRERHAVIVDDEEDDDAEEDALEAYARSKQRDFLKQYGRQRPVSSVDEKPGGRDLIYAHPYGEPLGAYNRHRLDVARMGVLPTGAAATTGAGAGGHRHRKTSSAIGSAAVAVGSVTTTSATGSSGNTFLSSDSVSIPEMRSSSYPEATPAAAVATVRPLRSTSVGIQTSDSLLRPILKQHQRPPSSSQQHKDRRYSPLRTDAMWNQPRVPVAMPPVSYTITFHPTTTSLRPDSNASAAAAAAPAHRRTPAEPDTTATTALSVQEYLRNGRPRFLASANRRRDCVREMNELRRRRNEQREQLLQQATATAPAGGDVDELCRRLRELDAPVPLTQLRCFTTRELLAATRSRCRRLPEVRERNAAERAARMRRAQRQLSDVFSHELRRRVLRGRVNLSNSVMVTN